MWFCGHCGQPSTGPQGHYVTDPRVDHAGGFACPPGHECNGDLDARGTQGAGKVGKKSAAVDCDACNGLGTVTIQRFVANTGGVFDANVEIACQKCHGNDLSSRYAALRESATDLLRRLDAHEPHEIDTSHLRNVLGNQK